MTQYWYALKQELAKVNVYGWENTDILTVSERFFELANTTVSLRKPIPMSSRRIF